MTPSESPGPTTLFPQSLQALAQLLSGQVIGSPDIVITGIADIENADTGDLVFTIWPHALCRMDWTTREIRTIAEYNAWHIAPDRRGVRVLCDTNHPDEGLQIIDVATGVRRVVYASSNHVMGGYQDDPAPRLTTEMPPRPGAHYVSGGQQRDRTYAFALLTFALGAAFLALELREFAGMVAIGATPQRSAFLSAFFTLVGCHGLHVTAGLIWLAVMMTQVAVKGFRPNVQRRLLCFALFWHALDIIWVWLFTVVYLMGVHP